MEERVQRAGPDVVDESLVAAAVLSADRLETRVAALGAQVRTLVPQDKGRLPRSGHPTDGIRGSLDRVRALELLLSQARAREDHLTIQTFHDQVTLTELLARIEDLEGMTPVEADTEARAADAACRLALVEAELSSLRSKCEGFENERDEARERAAEAERRAVMVQEDFLTAQRQLANATELTRRIEAVRESPKMLESVGAPSPWVELQHLVSATPDPPAANGGLEAYEVEDTGDWLFDPTEAESAEEEHAPREPLALAEEAPLRLGATWNEGGGLLRRFRSRRRPAPAV